MTNSGAAWSGLAGADAQLAVRPAVALQMSSHGRQHNTLAHTRQADHAVQSGNETAGGGRCQVGNDVLALQCRFQGLAVHAA